MAIIILSIGLMANTVAIVLAVRFCIETRRQLDALADQIGALIVAFALLASHAPVTSRAHAPARPH